MSVEEKLPTVPKDPSGKSYSRAAGLPRTVYQKRIGSTKYIDIFDLSQYPERAFIGIAVHNVSTVGKLHIAIGDDFTEDLCFVVTADTFLAIDGQLFGYRIVDAHSGVRGKKIRAKLDTISGILSTGSLAFVAEPADGTTVVINGTTFEFSSDASAAPGRIKVALTGILANTLAALAVAINSNVQEVTAAATATDINLTSNLGGEDGDDITLSAGTSGATASGATLSGGSGGDMPIFTIW